MDSDSPSQDQAQLSHLSNSQLSISPQNKSYFNQPSIQSLPFKTLTLMNSEAHNISNFTEKPPGKSHSSFNFGLVGPSSNLQRKAKALIVSPLNLKAVSPDLYTKLDPSGSVEYLDNNFSSVSNIGAHSGRDSLLKLKLMQNSQSINEGKTQIKEIDETNGKRIEEFRNKIANVKWTNTLYTRFGQHKKSDSVLSQQASLQHLPPYLHYNLRQRPQQHDRQLPGHKTQLSYQGEKKFSESLYSQGNIRMPVIGVPRKKSP